MTIAKPKPNMLFRRHMLAGMGTSAVLLASRPVKAAVPVVIGKNGWLFPIWDNPVYIDPQVTKQVAATIDAAVSVFQAANIQVALCLLAAKSRVYADYMPGDSKISAAVEKRYAEGLKNLAPSGAIMFDHAAFMQACRKVAPDEDLFFKADTHWLPVGAASAAAEMASQIKQHAHLPPSSQRGVALSPPQYAVQEHNDLAALLPLAERAKYPYEKFLTRIPITSDAAGLLEDDSPDVVVVGNSFMQPAYGYAATLSAELDRPVGLAWRVHQFSPYWNMLDYLKSPAFTRQRPKLIVWTMHEADLNTPLERSEVWADTAMSSADFLAKLKAILANS